MCRDGRLRPSSEGEAEPFSEGRFVPPAPRGRLLLHNARHPLLDPEKVVPIDVDLDENTFVMVITGPNTGGMGAVAPVDAAKQVSGIIEGIDGETIPRKLLRDLSGLGGNERIAVIDHGKIVAMDSPDALKRQNGTESLEEAYLALTGSSIRDEKAGSGDQMRQFAKMWSNRR